MSGRRSQRAQHLVTLFIDKEDRPIVIMPARQAVRRLAGQILAGRAERFEVLEEDTGHCWHSERLVLATPLVVRWNDCIPPIDHMSGLSVRRPILFARDGWRCMYCLDTPSSARPGSRLTMDHVIPVWRFGSWREATRWENLVTSCQQCNTFKGGRTPEEAGMQLHTKPGLPLQAVQLAWLN